MRLLKRMVRLSKRCQRQSKIRVRLDRVRLGNLNVAEAQGGMAQLADKADLNRESLYRMLSERGKPEFKSLEALLHALGFRLAVTLNQ
jgi:hypothetical protein